ncbi:carbohydrate ABC transporter permease [Paenibacillus sp. MBLB2552]|uniref:Carbohydrate ABC transporter permease n=1 Tax=Paenibacillus mellifer TaxID=2937794 RepID=A0A9X1Y098_9BACL|nr:carbohydrate ABC transporter permease [Paenibacillus mellifer]MCK8488714.1 carbohydrate ABC transporter permease [Paenibacillus mellifer]
MNSSKLSKRVIPHLSLLVISLIMMYPIFWWVGASLKSNEEMSSVNLFPKNPRWSNFSEGWVSVPNFNFGHFYLNNFVLIGGVLFTTIVACSLVAFAFSRLDFPLRKIWFAIMLVTLMLPTQVTIVPQYVMFSEWGWINTYLPFYIPHLLAGGIGGPFFIYLLVQFMRSVPKELDEAAKIDGCSWFGIYWRIMLPLVKPALITVAIYCFLWNWDDFFGQMLYINSIDKYTVNLALKLFIDSQGSVPWGQLLAMSLVSIVPSVLIFFLAQKHFVEGASAGALKG